VTGEHRRTTGRSRGVGARSSHRGGAHDARQLPTDARGSHRGVQPDVEPRSGHGAGRGDGDPHSRQPPDAFTGPWNPPGRCTCDAVSAGKGRADAPASPGTRGAFGLDASGTADCGRDQDPHRESLRERGPQPRRGHPRVDGRLLPAPRGPAAEASGSEGSPGTRISFPASLADLRWVMDLIGDADS